MVTCLLPIAFLPVLSKASGMITDGRKPVGDAVVWFEGAEKATPNKYTISQKNKRFTPHVLVITKGSTVAFPNDDNIFHNVYATFNAEKFDLQMYRQGESRSWVFRKNGLVSVLCNLHCEMSAYIYVVDTPYFTKSDSRGRYEIQNLPPGNYTMHVWHESGKKASIEVKVGDNPPSFDAIIQR